MRSAWLDHVKATKKKGNRGKANSMSHKEAMAAASKTWAKEKKKIERRLKRQKSQAKTEPVQDRSAAGKDPE